MLNGPLRQLRRPMPSDRQQENALTIMDLDDVSLGTILDFLPGHFRVVASVNRRFRWIYHDTAAAPKNRRCYKAAMASDATRAIWLAQDEANVSDKGCIFVARIGNLEALQ